MRVIIQRVSSASVTIGGNVKGKIDNGVMVLAGYEESDTANDIEWVVSKIVNMRIFNDEQGIMNISLLDKGFDVLLVSQFTLHASTKKGNRPSYIKAAKPDISIPLYESTIREFEKLLGKPIQTGEFGADMKVALVNDGPVTILLDSKNKE